MPAYNMITKSPGKIAAAGAGAGDEKLVSKMKMNAQPITTFDTETESEDDDDDDDATKGTATAAAAKGSGKRVVKEPKKAPAAMKLSSNSLKRKLENAVDLTSVDAATDKKVRSASGVIKQWCAAVSAPVSASSRRSGRSRTQLREQGSSGAALVETVEHLTGQKRENQELFFKLIEDPTRNKETIDMLKKHRANTFITTAEHETALHLAVLHANYDLVVAFICDWGAVIEAKTVEGETPLHYALQAPPGTEQHCIVWVLLGRGKANPDAVNNDGETPLHLAAQDGNEDVANVLLSIGRGANVNAQDMEGWVPLMYAANGGAKGHVEIVERFVREKALDIRIKNNLGADSLYMPTHKARVLLNNRIRDDEDPSWREREHRKKMGFAEFSEEEELSAQSSSDSESDMEEVDVNSKKKKRDDAKNKEDKPKKIKNERLRKDRQERMLAEKLEKKRVEALELAVQAAKQAKLKEMADFKDARKNLRRVRAKLSTEVNSATSKSNHLIRIEALLVETKKHPSQKDSQHWHRAYLLERLRTMRRLAHYDSASIRTLHEMEENAILMSTATNHWEDFTGGGRLYEFLEEVKPMKGLKPTPGLPARLSVGWALGKQGHTLKLREELRQFYLEAKLCYGMRGNNAECQRFWQTNLGEISWTVFLRDVFTMELMGALTGHIAYTTDRNPVFYITLLRTHEKCMKIEVQKTATKSRKKEVIPSLYMFQELQSYGKALVEQSDAKTCTMAHVITQAVGYRFHGHKNAYINLGLTHKTSNDDKGRKYWEKVLYDNSWAEFFGAQLIPCFIGLNSHSFVEEECAFKHNFLYAKPGTIERLSSLSPENIKVNVLTSLQADLTAVKAGFDPKIQRSIQAIRSAAMMTKEKKEEKSRVKQQTQNSRNASASQSPSTSAPRSRKRNNIINSDSDSDSNSSASTNYDPQTYEDLLEIAHDRAIVVENPYLYPKRSLPERKADLIKELCAFDYAHEPYDAKGAAGILISLAKQQ